MTVRVPVRYLLQSESDLHPDARRWLHADEAAVEQRFRFERPLRNWRLGRWTGKRAMALALELGEDVAALARLSILPAPGGAPTPALDDLPAPLAISMSHSEDRGFCAVAPADTAIGCDIEWIEARSRAFVETFFTPDERARWYAADTGMRPLVATRTWSAKESALKLLREGLRLDTFTVEVTVEEGGEPDEWSPLSVHYRDDGRVFHGWWRQQQGFVLTLVSEPAPATPRLLGVGGGRPD